MHSNNPQHNKRRRAFSLVELIVVTAIFGLLSSIVLVSVASSRIKARDAATLAQFEQVRIAFESYYNHHGGYPNPCYQAGTCGSSNIYCIGVSSCKFLGSNVSQSITLAPLKTEFASAESYKPSLIDLLIPTAHAAEFPLSDTPSIDTTATVDGTQISGVTKGFIYMPCDMSTPYCYEGSASDVAPTYRFGIISQTLGTWESLNVYNSRLTAASLLDNFTNPGGSPTPPGTNPPGSPPGTIVPPGE